VQVPEDVEEDAALRGARDQVVELAVQQHHRLGVAGGDGRPGAPEHSLHRGQLLGRSALGREPRAVALVDRAGLDDLQELPPVGRADLDALARAMATSPSSRSLASACRTGIRLRFSRPATWASFRSSPGAKRQVMMWCLMAS
jgi:hypothetical protein